MIAFGLFGFFLVSYLDGERKDSLPAENQIAK